jgi:hypothetical protein
MKLNLVVGDKITVKTEVKCYYSGYAGRPVQTFKPGDVAVVKQPKCPNVHRFNGEYFAFCTPESFSWSEGLGIDYSNIVILKNK